VTWNVDAKAAPDAAQLQQVFRAEGIRHDEVDLYVFGSQETTQFETQEVLIILCHIVVTLMM